VVFGLLVLLGMSLLSHLTEAKPVAVPLVKTEEGDLSAIFPNAVVLQGLLLSNALALIIFLVRSIWSGFLRSKDKTEEKLDEVYRTVQEMRIEMRSLQDAPDEDEIIRKLEHRIELMTLRAIRDHMREGK